MKASDIYTATTSPHTPILFGDIYCSPRCGFNCKKAAYDRAVREAKQLAEQLGPDWEPRIWENMGWHFKAVKGCCAVSPDTLGSPISGDYTFASYTAIFNNGVNSTVGKGDTPQAAVEAALNESRADIATLQREIAAVAA